MEIRNSKTGYSTRLNGGATSYTTAEGHEHIVSYDKKTDKATVLWGKKFKITSRNKKSSGTTGG